MYAILLTGGNSAMPYFVWVHKLGLVISAKTETIESKYNDSVAAAAADVQIHQKAHGDSSTPWLLTD